MAGKLTVHSRQARDNQVAVVAIRERLIGNNFSVAGRAGPPG